MSIKRGLACMASVAVLAGCSVGVHDGVSPEATFQVKADVRETYLRAVDQAQACLRGEAQHPVVAELDASGQRGLVRVAPTVGGDLARILIVPAPGGGSQVRAQLWGQGTWSANQLDAMRDALQTGVSSCWAYMPR